MVSPFLVTDTTQSRRARESVDTSKNETIVQYTLANMTNAVGVADYEGLPPDVQAAVPSAAEFQEVLAEYEEGTGL